MTDPLMLPAILRLPQELLDDILSLLDLHCDLINFAMASRTCTRLVIPRHSEYRVIRTRYILPHVWEHLARRADLARNIREVQLCLRTDYAASDHSPTSLLKGPLPSSAMEAGQGIVTARNMGIAISHMQYLHTFTWDWDNLVTPDPQTKLTYEYSVFNALSHLSHLSRLSLGHTFMLRFPNGITADGTYPLWDVSNLTVLSLNGINWTRPIHVPHVLSLLQRSPNLLHLDLPAEFRLVDSLKFPNLESLRLLLQSGATFDIDLFTARFLERHPSIKRLQWSPVRPDSSLLKPDSLPNLQLLRTSGQVVNALNQGSCVRRITSLGLLNLSRNMLGMRGIDRHSLKRVLIKHFDKLSTLRDFALTFHSITHLSLPPFSHSELCHAIDLETWLELLSGFPNLEVVRGLFLWRAVEWDKTRMHQVICTLVDLCPQLRELDSQQYNPKRNGYNRIVVIREMDEDDVVHVRYRIEKPQPRRLFDQLEHGL